MYEITLILNTGRALFFRASKVCGKNVYYKFQYDYGLYCDKWRIKKDKVKEITIKEVPF